MSERQRPTIAKPPVHRIAVAQLIALMPPLGVLWLFQPLQAKAAMAGVMIELSARAYFAFYAFRFTGAQQMRQVVRSFRRGELGKFMLVVVLFGALFALNKAIPPIAVFTGYFISWLLGTLLSMRMLR